jgi:hypothetical protein
VSDGIEDIPDLSVDEVAQRLGTPGFYVYDTNHRGRWKRSHVPGAILLDPYEMTAEQLPTDTQATLVFYCAGPG